MRFAEKGPPSIWPILGSTERAERGLAFEGGSRVEHGPVPVPVGSFRLPVQAKTAPRLGSARRGTSFSTLAGGTPRPNAAAGRRRESRNMKNGPI